MIIILKIQHVQTVLLEEHINLLKQKSGKQTTKDAVAEAVEHYLLCNAKEIRQALQAARDYIAVNMAKNKAASTPILQQIDVALQQE